MIQINFSQNFNIYILLSMSLKFIKKVPNSNDVKLHGVEQCKLDYFPPEWLIFI